MPGEHPATIASAFVSALPARTGQYLTRMTNTAKRRRPLAKHWQAQLWGLSLPAGTWSSSDSGWRDAAVTKHGASRTLGTRSDKHDTLLAIQEAGGGETPYHLTLSEGILRYFQALSHFFGTAINEK